jgi:PilZ domain-containing protein
VGYALRMSIGDGSRSDAGKVCDGYAAWDDDGLKVRGDLGIRIVGIGGRFDIWGMSRWTAIAKMIDEIDKPESRMNPRFLARRMSCNGCGLVMDFSATGVRVQYTKRPKFAIGDKVDLSLDSDVGTHAGEAEVVRLEKLGFRKYEVGYRFTDPDAAKKMQLFKCGYDALEDGCWSAA